MSETKVEYVTGYPVPAVKGESYMVWMFAPKDVPNTRALRARFRERHGYEAENVLTCENTRTGMVGIGLGPVKGEG